MASTFDHQNGQLAELAIDCNGYTSEDFTPPPDQFSEWEHLFFHHLPNNQITSINHLRVSSLWNSPSPTSWMKTLYLVKNYSYEKSIYMYIGQNVHWEKWFFIYENKIPYKENSVDISIHRNLFQYIEIFDYFFQI